MGGDTRPTPSALSRPKGTRWEGELRTLSRLSGTLRAQRAPGGGGYGAPLVAHEVPEGEEQAAEHDDADPGDGPVNDGEAKGGRVVKADEDEQPNYAALYNPEPAGSVILS